MAAEVLRRHFKRVIMRHDLTAENGSMVHENDLVAVFHSVHKVMKAEKVLKQAGAPVLLIPTPRQLSSDCGLALRFEDRDREQIEMLLREADVPIVELYRKQGKEYLAL